MELLVHALTERWNTRWVSIRENAGESVVGQIDQQLKARENTTDGMERHPPVERSSRGGRGCEITRRRLISSSFSYS